MFEIFIRVLSALLMMALPVALFVFLRRRLDAAWRFIRIGALTFFASQVFHIPFNMIALPALLKKLGLDSLQDASGANLLIVAMFLGLSAGVFEEVARYLVYRYWLTTGERTWKNAVTLGAGHGGCEAILLGLAAVITLVQMIALRTADLSKILPPDKVEQAQEQIQWYWSLSWYDVLMQPVERATAMTFHVSASVLVVQVFLRENRLWLGAAIAFHTILDMVAVVGMVQKWNMEVLELVIAALVVPAALTIIFHFRQQQADFHSLPQQEEADADTDRNKPSFVNEREVIDQQVD